jgi:hypothetical protein
VVELGETCDPCPASCDDGNACTDDYTNNTLCSTFCSHAFSDLCPADTSCCPNGCTAKDSSGCCQVFLYRDSDGDGYGNSSDSIIGYGTIQNSVCVPAVQQGYVANAQDCCDSDAEAHPGQTSYYSAPRQGCGGYDYDCDGSETRQYPTAASKTFWYPPGSSLPQACYCNSGWDGGSVPGCGMSKYYLNYYSPMAMDCGCAYPVPPPIVTQGCR